jgi:hypothetical protein
MLLLSCPISSISSNGNHTDLCRLYRYKEYLRQEIVADGGPQVVHLKYDVTIAKSTRILDDMKGIQSVKCTNSSLTLTLTPGLNASLMSQEFQLRSVVAGGREWGCLSSIVGEPATAMDFTRKVRSVSTDINLHLIVLGTTDCNAFDAFEEQDIDIWSEYVVTPDSNLRSKSSSRSQSNLPVSDTSSTRGDWVNIDFRPKELPVQWSGERFLEGSSTSSATSTTTTTATTTTDTTKATTTVTDTTTTTASVTKRISVHYQLSLRVTFRFMIRAGTSYGNPTLFDYESWIKEDIIFLAMVKATLSAQYFKIWKEEIVSSVEILAIPGMQIGGVGVPVGLYGKIALEMKVDVSGMLQAEVGMVVSRTRTYGSRLSQECTPLFSTCRMDPIDVGTEVSYDPIFDWGGKVVAVITPSLELGLTLTCGIVLPSTSFTPEFKVGFALYSGLKIYLEATLKYGIGSQKLQSLHSSEVDEFRFTSTRETCQKFHEVEVKVEAGLRWTGLILRLNPFYPEKSLLAARDLLKVKLFIACYNSGGTWSVCASEGEQCSCPGGIVRFGANGAYAPIKEVITSTGITCNSNAFGADPIAGTRKSCACSQCAAGQYLYQPVTTATVVCFGGCLCQPSRGTSSGTISHGQGNYRNDAHCTFFIAVDPFSDSRLISLTFSSFDTELNRDFVTIWRCTSNVCFERVAKLSGDSVSPNTEFRSSTGYMQVEFESDPSVVSSGFVASWKVASPDDKCTDCPTNSNSPARLSSVKGTSCTCNAGSTGPNGGPCEPCLAGKYKTLTGTATCTNCGAGTYSPAGSAACMNCGAGRYSTAVGAQVSSTCIACPSNSNSPAGSAALTSCTCNTGSTRSNGGSCTQCVAGKYKALTGTATCTDCGTGTYSTTLGAADSSKCSACPSNSNSPAGSAALTSCTCNAGSPGPNGGPCAPCVAGKYKVWTGTVTCEDCGAGTYSAAVGASTSSTCSVCPSNSNSPAGSAALTSCTCNTGSTGPNGGPCATVICVRLCLSCL